jgi:hypothetical protein
MLFDLNNSHECIRNEEKKNDVKFVASGWELADLKAVIKFYLN